MLQVLSGKSQVKPKVFFQAKTSVWGCSWSGSEVLDL